MMLRICRVCGSALGLLSVFKTMYRCGDAAGAGDEGFAAESVDGHYGCVAEETSEFYVVAYCLSYHRDYPDCSCLLVDHSDSSFIRYDA